LFCNEWIQASEVGVMRSVHPQPVSAVGCCCATGPKPQGRAMSAPFGTHHPTFCSTLARTCWLLVLILRPPTDALQCSRLDRLHCTSVSTKGVISPPCTHTLSDSCPPPPAPTHTGPWNPHSSPHRPRRHPLRLRRAYRFDRQCGCFQEAL
jgi:hypothetical protein